MLDTETTGLGKADRVIELAAIKVMHGTVVDKRTQLFSPGFPLPEQITRLTHITDDMLWGKPPIANVLPRFLQFVDHLPVVGHNVSFDVGMLMREGERAGIPVRLETAADTLSMSRILLPELPSHRLEVLARELQIPSYNAHRALADVYATYEVYLRLVEMENQRNLAVRSRAALRR